MPHRTWRVAAGLIGAGLLLGSCSQNPQSGLSRPTSAAAKPPAAAPVSEPVVSALLARLPRPQPLRLDATEALFLAALPLSCLDRPQTLGPRLAAARYLFRIAATPLSDIAKNRAFYGCYDWHSAVNSTWALVALLREYPQSPVASLVREKLKAHLGKRNIAGEVAFFRERKTFELPYGRSWLLKLDAALLTWNDPDARKWAANLRPLVQLFEPGLREYMKTLPYPIRTGVHPNTAYSMNLLLDYAAAARDTRMRQVVDQAALRLFANDTACPTAYEPDAAEFISPCLEEAKLMSRVMPQKRFLAWFDRFLPPVDSPKFRPLWRAFNVSGISRPSELAGKSHLIGLAFARAEAMERIADALPPADPRVLAYRRLAAVNAAGGMKHLEAAGYLGSHWLGTYALGYLLAENSPSGLPVASAALASAGAGQ